MTIKYYEINEKLAKQAKQLNSFYEYVEGSATKYYKEAVDKAYEIAEQQKRKVDPMYHDKIDSKVDSYAKKLADNINEANAIDVRVPSIMIAGPVISTSKKEKQNAARMKNIERYREIEHILDSIQSIGSGGISADDKNAIPKLEKKLQNCIDSQNTMKEVNKYYRKNGTLEGCPMISENLKLEIEESMKRHPYYPVPFPPYALQNNNAEIKRLKDRIQQLKILNETEFTGWDFKGGSVVVNKENNRLQILFDDKPNEDIRSKLKSNAFRWSPREKAWQRQLTENAFYAIGQIEEVKPLDNKSPLEMFRQSLRNTVKKNKDLLQR